MIRGSPFHHRPTCMRNGPPSVFAVQVHRRRRFDSTAVTADRALSQRAPEFFAYPRDSPDPRNSPWSDPRKIPNYSEHSELRATPSMPNKGWDSENLGTIVDGNPEHSELRKSWECRHRSEVV